MQEAEGVWGLHTKLRWTDGTEARVTMQAEARSWRGHIGHQSKVAASAGHTAALHWPTKSGVLM
jgi:hypothetical protein